MMSARSVKHLEFMDELVCLVGRFSRRALASAADSSSPGGGNASRGGHADRTRLENDIYDDSPAVEAEQRYEQQKERDAEDELNLKEKILSAALCYVPRYGWSKKAIIAGTEAAGFPPMTHGMFSQGPIELVHHFYASANQELADKLAADVQAVEDGLASKKGGTKFIRDAVVYRLQMLIPYKETWPQAMGLMALPQNTRDSLKHLSDLMDDIWYYAGDRSADFNWYTKRALLAAAYKTTEIYLLQDQSPDYTETWSFLDRRLKNITTAGKSIRQIQETSGSLGSFLFGSTIMARNVLGMNDQNR